MPKTSQPSSLSGSPRQKSDFALLNRSGVKTSPSSPVPPPRRNSNHVVNHSQMPTPSIDDMQPQSISFIGMCIIFLTNVNIKRCLTIEIFY